MILLKLSKISFSLIGKGFSNECGLDPLNLITTILICVYSAHLGQTQQVVMRCSLYQTKAYL